MSLLDGWAEEDDGFQEAQSRGFDGRIEMEERQIWERLPDEPLLWFRRFERFRLMTPTRSIAKVYQEENKEKQGKTRTEADATWYQQAKQWRWNERAAAWDKVQTEHLEKVVESEKARVVLEGFAVMHRRVAQLNAEAEQLLAYAQDESKVWLPDVKAVGTGEFAERVDLVQFNAPLFHEIRAHFDDIAKELGQRVKKMESKVILPKQYLEPLEAMDDDGVEQ